MYKGVWPTIQRATVVSLLTLPTYDWAKDFLQRRRFADSIPSQCLAGAFSCLVSVYGSQPMDVIKTRIMNQPVRISTDGRARGVLYRNSWDCVAQTVRHEGMHALWKGSVPNLCRGVPWAIVFWLSYEWMKKMFGS